MGATTCLGIVFIMWCEPQAAPQIDAARFCRTAAPITWSESDTAETKRQVKANNAKWKAICAQAPE